MTNLQLLLSIGIPSVLVVLGWMHQNTRLSDMRSELKSDIQSLQSEMATLRSDMNQGFRAINEQFMHSITSLAASKGVSTRLQSDNSAFSVYFGSGIVSGSW